MKFGWECDQGSLRVLQSRLSLISEDHCYQPCCSVMRSVSDTLGCRSPFLDTSYPSCQKVCHRAVQECFALIYQSLITNPTEIVSAFISNCRNCFMS